MKLIISQRYMKKDGGGFAALEELLGDDVLLRNQHGGIEKIAIEHFKRHYTPAYRI